MKNGERPRYIMPAANGHQAIVEILINSIADNVLKKSFLSIQDHTYHDDHSLCRKDEGMVVVVVTSLALVNLSRFSFESTSSIAIKMSSFGSAAAGSIVYCL